MRRFMITYYADSPVAGCPKSADGRGFDPTLKPRDDGRIVLTVLRLTLAAFFIGAGANHFIHPGLYLGFMPSWLPHPLAINRISGAAEVAGGIGLLVPSLRFAAGWGLVTLLVAVYPANLYAAALGHMPGLPFSSQTLWLRLPFQAVFVVWIWWVALRRPVGAASASERKPGSATVHSAAPPGP